MVETTQLLGVPSQLLLLQCKLYIITGTFASSRPGFSSLFSSPKQTWVYSGVYILIVVVIIIILFRCFLKKRYRRRGGKRKSFFFFYCWSMSCWMCRWNKSIPTTDGQFFHQSGGMSSRKKVFSYPHALYLCWIYIFPWTDNRVLVLLHRQSDPLYQS